MRKMLMKLMVFVLLFSFIPTQPANAAKKPKLSKSSLNMTIGKSIKLKVKNTKKKVKWSSTKKSVASVTKKGVVTAKKVGSTTIKAKVGKTILKCKVQVKRKISNNTNNTDNTNTVSKITGIYLNETSVSLLPKQTKKIEARYRYIQYDVSPTFPPITWKSSNPQVATVNNGVVTAVAKGVATITASGGGFSANCKVTVELPNPVSTITLGKRMEIISTDDKEYRKVSEYDGEWDENGDCTINGVLYHRQEIESYYSNVIRYYRYIPLEWNLVGIEDGVGVYETASYIDKRKFNENNVNITWEKCSLRSWLNGYDDTTNEPGIDYTNNNFFTYTKMTSTEKNMLINTKFSNPANEYYETYSGPETTDKVFLMTDVEARTRIENTVSNTAFCVSGEGPRIWWTRTIGQYENSACCLVAVHDSKQGKYASIVPWWFDKRGESVTYEGEVIPRVRISAENSYKVEKK